MTTHRPVSVLVIAILGLIGGVLNSCCSLVHVGSPFAEPLLDHGVAAAAGDAPDPQEKGKGISLGDTRAEVVAWALAMVDLVVGVLMIVMAIGLLRMRPWARRLGLACAVLLLATSLGWIGQSVWEQATKPSEDADLKMGPVWFAIEKISNSAVLDITVTVLLCLGWMAYGVATWIVLRRPKVRAAFRT